MRPFRRTYTMGDLSSGEARTFFFEYVLPSFPKAPSGASDAWERVYETCGWRHVLETPKGIYDVSKDTPASRFA